jgi:SpoVK/Ycf46/Vps4 family AAA+-type ATPase
MALARQILEVLRSHVEGDEERFRVAALQLAASEARQGHSAIAEQIQKLVEQSQKVHAPASTNSVAFGSPHGELRDLLEFVQPMTRLKQLVLSGNLEKRLERILKEQKQFGKLREHGLRPRQRILLLGPPGCGKTMTAHVLAHELGLPLFVVRFDALFTKYLGETASKLRLVFESVERVRAVFLFDEFDSLGLARGTQHDVAEMRRVLNSFLVFIDNIQGHSLVIAASNHPESLDVALFRRFDDIIEYSHPTAEQLSRLFEQRLAGENTERVLWDKVINKALGMSFAEAARAAEEVIKERLIEQRSHLTTASLLKAIDDRVAYARPRLVKKR